MIQTVTSIRWALCIRLPHWQCVMEKMLKRRCLQAFFTTARSVFLQRRKSAFVTYHLSVSDVEMKNPSLLHAKLGAFLAARNYHVEDREILNAITCHTTGTPHMTRLDKILYIADYIEPGRRELPNIAKVRHGVQRLR